MPLEVIYMFDYNTIIAGSLGKLNLTSIALLKMPKSPDSAAIVCFVEIPGHTWS
jgi:hypothetical protein